MSYREGHVKAPVILPNHWVVITSHNTISLSVVVLSMLGDDIIQTEKYKLYQRAYCALFKLWMWYKGTDQRLLHQWSFKIG